MNDKETQGTAAVGFLIMAFTDETAADEALKAMKAAKKQQQFYFEDAAVIRQDGEGKVHYQETGDMRTGKGAGAGALIGGILGILGGPAGIALGASAGAALGAAAAHGDAGFRDESLKSVGIALKPGTSAVTAITSHAFLKAVQKQVDVADIRGFVNTLAQEISDRLAEGRNIALGIILAESGLAIKEVAVGEDSAEVIGVAITDEAVVAGAAVVTEGELDYEVGVFTKGGEVVEVGAITEDQAVVLDYIETKDASEPDEMDESDSTETQPGDEAV